MQKQLSIVIPFYNEEKSIPVLLPSLQEMVLENPFIEIILVNNGSTDNSVAVFAEYLTGSEKSSFIPVHIPVNKGYGYGILAGLEKATAPVLSWTHADLQTNPKDVLRAYALYLATKNDTLLVKGKRRNRNPIDHFFTWGMQVYCYFKLGVSLKDINAQPKLFSRVFFEQIYTNAPHDFSLDLYFMVMAKKLGTIRVIDVFFTKRLYGTSKGGGTWKGKWNLIRRTVQYVDYLSATIKK
jgi:glycosyltransferase involved in cell wall biosynthesis